MDTGILCAYNLTRGVFLSSKVTVADPALQPLKILEVLVAGLGLDSVSGLWLSPLSERPSVPRLFPFDILYLDRYSRLLDLAEVSPGVQFPLCGPGIASALLLPSRTLTSTRTERGDRLIICSEQELERMLGAGDGAAVPLPDALVLGNTALIEHASISSVVEMPVSNKIPALNGAAGPAAETTPVMSITEVILESSEHALPLGEQAERVDELFSNWVEASSFPSGWAARNPSFPDADPHANPEELQRQEAVGTMAAETVPDLTETSSETTVSTNALTVERVDTASRCEVASEPKPVPAKVEPRAVNPLPGSTSTRTALPLSHHATTFTVANYGMWRVSMPTAVVPIVSRSMEQVPLAGADSSAEAAKQSIEDATPAEPSTDSVGVDQVSTRFVATPASGTFAEHIEETVRAHNSVEKHEPTPIAALNPRNTEEEHRTSTANSKQNSAIGDSIPARPVSAEVSKGTTPTLPETVKPGQKEQPKVALRRIETNNKTQPQPAGLGARLKRWLNPVAAVRSDRRRAYRRYVPGMIAHYYTGGSPKPHEVADISMTGFYVLTEDHWMPDTMIQMTLQRPCAKGERKQSITVLSRIVRRGSDGVAAEFVMSGTLDSHSHDVQPSQTTDRFALARFL